MHAPSTTHFPRLAAGIVLLSTLLAGNAGPVYANSVCYVKADAAGLNTGSSWGDAYTDLQSALGSSLCAEIWVARGIYKPTGTTDRTISFVLKSGVALYGGFAGTETLLSERDPAANPTILSGEIGDPAVTTDNSDHVVVGSGTDSTALLDGFTVTAGHAGTWAPPDVAGEGGGMYNSEGDPTLANVTFSANWAGLDGGGMYNSGSNPSLTNVTFTGNIAQGSIAEVQFGRGGGMLNAASSPSLVNVIFSNNSATTGGGGMANIGGSSPTLTNVAFSNNRAYWGGGIYNDRSNPSLTNVTFVANRVTTFGGQGGWGGEGGGMYNLRSNPSLTNVTFGGNIAYGRLGAGGGMYNMSSSPSLTNVTFGDNWATQDGGGMDNWGSSPTLMNVTFSGNRADGGVGGAMQNQNDSSPVIVNSILYGDKDGEILNDTLSTPTVTYSIVQGGYPGTGNLDADPRLGPLQDNGGFTKTMALGFGSPAIDKGKNAGCPTKDQRGLARPQGPRCDMGAYEYPQTGLSLSSTGPQDGWVLESSETSNVGGKLNAGWGTLFLGDNAQDRQYRTILSFNTSGLPDDAVITSATMKIRGAGVVGMNPFATHGNILVDMRKGAFAGSAALQSQDFQAAASRNTAMILLNHSINGWYSKGLFAANFAYINKAGLTQFRLRFAKDDNDDLGADYLRFYSGNALNPALRPQLIITYYVP